MSRPDFDTYFMRLAYLAATRATCDRKHVGAIIVTPTRRVVATGYNGSPSGVPSCDEVGHELVEGHCLPASSLIPRFQTGRYNSRHLTVGDIFLKWQNARKRGALHRMKVRCMGPHGVLVPGTVEDIWERGVRDLIEVRTRLGRSIRITPDHPIWTPQQWRPFGDLMKGDLVALNGVGLVDDAAWLRRQYIELGITAQKIALISGVSRQVVRRRLIAHNIPLRPFRLGGWNRGLLREWNPTYKGDDVSASAARTRARRYALNPSCDVCGGDDRLQVHHFDENPWNDKDGNLITVCTPCHWTAHTACSKREKIVFDTVVDIRPAGKELVYDLTVGPYHNFVADGFVVHNCVRTLHAESNAIDFAGQAARGCALFVTVTPCYDCAKRILNSGIRRVIFDEFYGSRYGKSDKVSEFLSKAGIEVVQLDTPGLTLYKRLLVEMEKIEGGVLQNALVEFVCGCQVSAMEAKTLCRVHDMPRVTRPAEISG